MNNRVVVDSIFGARKNEAVFCETVISQTGSFDLKTHLCNHQLVTVPTCVVKPVVGAQETFST